MESLQDRTLSPRRQPAIAVEVVRDGPGIALVVVGRLDETAAGVLEDAAAALAAVAPPHLTIDLRRITAFTPAGADAVFRLRTAGDALPAGIRYRTGTGIGRRALEAAFGGRAPGQHLRG
jgi:hypothetical protein